MQTLRRTAREIRETSFEALCTMRTATSDVVDVDRARIMYRRLHSGRFSTPETVDLDIIDICRDIEEMIAVGRHDRELVLASSIVDFISSSGDYTTAALLDQIHFARRVRHHVEQTSFGRNHA